MSETDRNTPAHSGDAVDAKVSVPEPKKQAAKARRSSTPSNPRHGSPPAVVGSPQQAAPATPQAETATAAPPSQHLNAGDPSAALAGGPLAAATLGALAGIAAQFGDGRPTADTGLPTHLTEPANVRPTGPVLWDGGTGSSYAAKALGDANQANALNTLHTELGSLLNGAVDTTTGGRAQIGIIMAEVDSALNALGGVADTPAGRQMLVSALGNALQRASNVLGNGQIAAAATAEGIAALSARYLRQTQPQRRTNRRPFRRGIGSGPPTTMPTGEQGQWINEALRVLRANGYDTHAISPSDVAAIIQHESGGNPHAINLWDSNAAAGIPSKGLMQTIDPTFNAYSLPGHRDIWNPVDNIVAGVRYAIDRYGSVGNVPGIANLRSGGHYVGY
ncbi:DUF4226 domain-containing protein [Nocardia panacis]|uniref:DUF4226 domain-containing protein n=1 Tax=Nocardia panacis TaxID=2340916 RepID=A0A3A4KJ12_9NOCA|nr:transglycosylase SLT domain-containing protein [Nocardia panacis]RJO79860.1 DUF4226 domain-containing protein [Nocardia panacis]